jgi:hypothetical protein
MLAFGQPTGGGAYEPAAIFAIHGKETALRFDHQPVSLHAA